MDVKPVNQKEYLKKYLSSKKEKKKSKKKKINVGPKTVKIIDDDVDIRHMRALDEDEFDILNNTEDGPQIAGIIDERGPVDFSNKTRWRIITDEYEGDLIFQSSSDQMKAVEEPNVQTVSPNSSNRSKQDPSSPAERTSSKKGGYCSDSDSSPTRGSRKKSQRNGNDSDSESSLTWKSRKKSGLDGASLKKYRNKSASDCDLSPPREKTKKSGSDRKSSKKYRNKSASDSDLSPPREKTKKSDPDRRSSRKSRRNNDDSDLSPPREKRKHTDSDRRSSKKVSRHSDSDSDLNLPRKSQKLSDSNRQSSHRKHKRSRWNANVSPPRESSRNTSSEPSSSRKRSDIEPDSSRRDKHRFNSDSSPPRKAMNHETDDSSSTRRSEKGDKPSDNTANLAEASGFGMAPVVRDRKTGRKRDLAAEALEQREKDSKRQELEEKYAKWGKGLKQVEDQKQKLNQDLYEMSKPLARYADDADLERDLKAQEREGDPMLAYIKSKQVKEGKQEPDKPRYNGPFAPNRFGIKPGYRWDGVDRSNGYEKKWFEAQNARKAVQEEAYKWSISDM